MKKILVVDNHPVILKFMTQLLTEAGHHVLTAEDGLSALDLLQTYIPNVMFVDLIMPNIDGKKLCKIIRRMPDFNDVRLIILSGVAIEEQINPQELGADACIAKGTFAEMSQNVLRALGHSQDDLHARDVFIYGRDEATPRVITEELLAVKKHFEVVLESISEGILELKTDGRIIYANPTAKSILNIPEEEFLGKPLSHLFASDDRQRVEEMLQGVKCGPPMIGEDAPVKLGACQLSLTFLPILEEMKGTIVILNDITEKRRMAEQLQQAQKIEAIGLLAGGIAHDFNNILTAILGNISLAKMYLKPEDKSYSRLAEAEKASTRAKSLTMQLITFARGGAPVKKRESLSEIVGECCKYNLKNPAVRCEIKLDETIWPVEVDRGQTAQAIQNLLVNAEQAMPQGGTLRISAQNRIIDETSNVPLQFGRYVELLLVDQGVGIQDKDLPKIFDPYFAAKNRGGGFGLAIAYSIVKNHKGYIRVESNPDKGTRFYVYLPAATEAPRKPKGKKRLPSGKGRVLVMDDEKIVRDVVGEMLQFIGYKADFAKDGGAAVEKYKEAMASGSQFDAVIMDLTVPEGLGGKEAVKLLLDVDSKARVIVASGYSHDPIMSDYESFGFKGVVTKPFQIEDLDRVLQEVMTDGE